MMRRRSKVHGKPGAPPGIDRHPAADEPPPPGAIGVRCLDYGPDTVASREVEDLEAFLAEARPESAKVRWVNVDGLHPQVVRLFQQSYDFHTLAAEDILHVPQRSKQDPFDDHLFVVIHMFMLHEGALVDEQVSVVFRADTLLTFQERAGDVWDPVRKRIQEPRSRLRRSKGGYLLYALLDAVVDQFFPILEHFGDRLEELEERIVAQPTPKDLQDLYGIKHELVQLRRVLWPMRQLTDDLQSSEFPGIDKQTRTYLRDVYDHSIRVIEMVETYREMASGLTDLYMSSISNRMNEIMKVLTIMASLFIPVTFLAGVYGMNFENIPETRWEWAYPAFWAVCLVTLGGLLVYFHRKGWIGRG